MHLKGIRLIFYKISCNNPQVSLTGYICIYILDKLFIIHVCAEIFKSLSSSYGVGVAHCMIKLSLDLHHPRENCKRFPLSVITYL